LAPSAFVLIVRHVRTRGKFRKRNGGYGRLVGSDIDALINHGIDIDTEPASIDPRHTPSGVGNRGSRHEPVRPKLRDGGAIARDDEGPARRHLTKDGRRVITQFALGDHSVHITRCSTM
jgi:hypothetical protein